MKRSNFFVSIAVCFMLLFMAPAAFADLPAITASWNQDAADEIDRLSPGTTATSLGTRLWGPLLRDTDTVTTAGENTLDPNSCSTFLFTTPATQGIHDATFADGKPGAIVTFVLTTDNGFSVDITPDTKSGFSSVTLSDANDSCSLKWSDSTNGWVVAGNNGCTIN